MVVIVSVLTWMAFDSVGPISSHLRSLVLWKDLYTFFGLLASVYVEIERYKQIAALSA